MYPEAQIKRCTRCKVYRPLGDFFIDKSRVTRLSPYCFYCKRAYERQLRARRREDIFELLGHKCAQCGFDDKRALEVDHIFNDGAECRRKLKSNPPHQLLKQIKASIAAGNPRFQILCCNCNRIKKVIHERFGRMNQHRPQQEITTWRPLRIRS